MLTEDILIKKILYLESLVEQIQAELTQRAYIYAEDQRNRTKNPRSAHTQIA